MPRLTVQDLLNTLHQAAQEMRAAAGSDGQLSRQDFNRIIEDKTGNERTLLEAFYRFLREEDQRNMRITRDLLARGEKFIQEKIITQFELAPGGLSLQETNAIKALGEDPLALAFQLKRAASGMEYKSPVELFTQIQELTPDLFFDDLGSEGSQPLEAVHIAANVVELTPDSFAKALKLNAEDPKDAVARFVPAEEHFIKFIAQHYSFELDAKATTLVHLMKDHLRQNTVIVLGEDYHEDVPPQHPVYVVGVADDGSLIGFKSLVIWT
ncbi:MAG: nuclease A inhibitor family protein [Saprospiraceae bacterium]